MNNNTAYRKENKGTLASKKVLLKHNNEGKLSNKNENIKNNFIQQIEKEKNEDNLEEKKMEEIQMEEEGYLDDDLKDEDNKKIYLRVIKRLEKTLGTPVIGICSPGDAEEDIEMEEDIRPILLDNISDSYNNNYIEEKEINIKSELEYGQKNNNKTQLNKRNINYNEEDKSNNNNEILIKKEEEKSQIINKPNINKQIQNQKQYTQIRNNINKDTNININDRDKNQQKSIVSQGKKEDFREIRNNNINNNKQDIKYNLNINQNLPSSEKDYNYTKVNSNQQSNISAPSHINRNTSDDNFRNQKNISRGDNNHIYLSNSQILISSQNNEMKPYKKVLLKNQKYHNVSKSIDFNTIVYPDMKRGKDVCIDEQESIVSTGKIRIRKFIRGGKYNNVQTTYVVYSKKNKNSDLKFNKSPLVNNRSKYRYESIKSLYKNSN